MSSFNPMAAALDWLDAYRAADLSIVDMYAPNAVLECGRAMRSYRVRWHWPGIGDGSS
jgi:ketosteroid isomerase-like protein